MLISVIVPVYNVEKYLKECLNSILFQTHKDLEIILIDDGSSDRSGKICDDFAIKDSRIKTFHTENKGQASARNFGLDIAKGDYISFVDSDDIIKKDYIEKLYELIVKFNTKMSMINLQPFSEKLSKIDPSKTNNIKKVLNAKDLLMAICTGDISFAPWRFLYSKEIFKDLRFPKGQIYEDIYIAFDIIHNAKNIAYTDEICYFYRIRQGSTVHSFDEKHLIAVKSVERFANLIIKTYPQLKNEANYSICSSMFDVSIGILKAKKMDFYPKISEFSKLIRKNLKSVFITKTKHYKKKILIIILAIHPLLLNLVFKIYKRLK